LGWEILHIAALQPLFTAWYNMPFVPWIRFYNTLVAGGIVGDRSVDSGFRPFYSPDSPVPELRGPGNPGRQNFQADCANSLSFVYHQGGLGNDGQRSLR
jgi:hypothetical protein